jgi:hypothetical protein
MFGPGNPCFRGTTSKPVNRNKAVRDGDEIYGPNTIMWEIPMVLMSLSSVSELSA